MYIRHNVIDYTVMSSAWQLPYTTLYFAPSKVIFFVHRNYLNSTAHSRTYAYRKWNVLCLKFHCHKINAMVTYNTIDLLIKITYIAYNVPVINIS